MLQTQEKTSQRRMFGTRQIIGILISVVCVYAIFRQVDLHEVSKAIVSLEWGYLFLGIISLAIGYYLRIYRWSIMLRASGATAGPKICAAPFLGSIALNNILPFRAGDAVRAFVFPHALGIRRMTATASLLLERIIDLLTLLLSLSLGLMFIELRHIPHWLEDSVISLSILGGAALAFIILFNAPLKKILISLMNRLSKNSSSYERKTYLFNAVLHLLNDLAVMSHIRIMLPVFILSMLVWAGEAGLFLAVLSGLHIEVPIATAILVMSLSTLSTLVPSSPGYVGPFHLAAFTAITMVGGDSALAASYAILVHLGLWLPTTLAGGISILFNPNLFKLNSSRLQS